MAFMWQASRYFYKCWNFWSKLALILNHLKRAGANIKTLIKCIAIYNIYKANKSIYYTQIYKTIHS